MIRAVYACIPKYELNQSTEIRVFENKRSPKPYNDMTQYILKI